MISMCTNEASVNIGIYTGRCKQIKNNGWNWPLKIHCANHCLEVAIGSAYTDQPEFKIIDPLPLTIYQLFKTSGNLRWLLTSIALNWGVTCIFVQSHGTKFQNQKYRAIKVLLINLVPLYLLCKNMIAGGHESCHSATTFSLANDFYNGSLILRNAKTTMFDYWYCWCYQQRERKIMELQSSECKLLFPSVTNKDCNIKTDAAAMNLPANQTFKTQNQLSEKQKAKALTCITIHKEIITAKKVFHGKHNVKCIQITSCCW